ncbi:aminotransferase class V-fold PLP-dependent enzyme [Hydrotalea sp.]|uniref:aminotransferase class V-fold PLP-dependent enzyme n=1 Tax=Hydrotalea sp. TaxID=2881279 RepID=UPI00260D4DEE|nr:cysteine desulfurase [Hydrotalea sp.]
METANQKIIPTFPIAEIRQHFPLLQRTIHNKPIVYLDNAATTQKPMEVIDALRDYYMRTNANIHRGIHTLAEEATAAYEATRSAVQGFIHSSFAEEIIFTRGTTESINLVANTWGKQNIQEGDEIIISEMEHHSNIVPWQLLCEEKKAVLKIIPINDDGELLMDVYQQLLSSKTKLVAVTYVSNSLGTINPIAKIISLAHNAGALVLVDGAQATVHLDIDVQKMDCDFYAFSGHKIYGPTGVGVLYGKKSLLEAMPVFMGGGEMIKEVSFAKTTYAELPYKYEAGTPNIADTVALKAAIDFMLEVDVAMIHQHENALLEYATEQMLEIPNLYIYGRAKHKTGVISFLVKNIHPQDMGVLLDNQAIAVRTGHHCTQPLMHRLGVPGTIRASFAVYNTMEEIDKLVSGIQKSVKMLL